MIYIAVLFLQMQLIHCMPNTDKLILELHECQIDNSNKRCSLDLMAEKENFVMNGSVKFPSNGLSWKPYLTIQYNHSSTNYQFKHMCSIDTRIAPSMTSTSGCYCYKSSNDVKQFMINRTAKFEYSGAEIRAVMQYTNDEKIISPIRRLPPIIKNFYSTLEADGRKLERASCDTECNLTSSTIKLCCFSDDGPCNPTIYNNGKIANYSAGDCTVINLELPEKNNLKLEFKVSDIVIKTCIVTEQDPSLPTGNTNKAYFLLLFLIVVVIVLILIFILYKKGCFPRILNSLQLLRSFCTETPLSRKYKKTTKDQLEGYTEVLPVEDSLPNMWEHILRNHGTEICYESEADLHKQWIDCKTNPGHVNFKPVNDFNLNHLPARYRDVIMLEVIKALSALTVLIKVKHTSLERPEYGGCLRGQYPFFNHRGCSVLRTGTGSVYRVVKHTESDNNGTCPCGKCQHSDTPSKVWGEIRVVTATHVVFDNSEVRQTRCVVGFDDPESPGVSLDGWEVGRADIERDWCKFTCVSCDLDVVDKLDKMCQHFDDLYKKVVDKYWGLADVGNLTIIVSHPHGCPKRVSVGEWAHNHEIEDCACPGSSGAFIYKPGHSRCLMNPHMESIS